MQLKGELHAHDNPSVLILMRYCPKCPVLESSLIMRKGCFLLSFRTLHACLFHYLPEYSWVMAMAIMSHACN
jgi:hypothetical protein